MNKVTTMQEAYRVFELLGMKEVTKKWQKKQGTEVWELPFKTMYYNGHAETNRFSIYKSGYVRKMVVHPTKGTSYSCYQLNKTRKKDYYYKDYKWNDDYTEQTFTGKYCKSYSIERIMIDTHRDRVVYLCNYILKNYYRNNKCAIVGEYTMKRVTEVHDEWSKNQSFDGGLPWSDQCESETFTKDEVKVIINGHRYNLS